MSELTKGMSSQELQTLSVLVTRMNLATKLGMSYDNKRDLYKALGYPFNLTYADMYGRYRRQDIVKAVVDKPIKATWRKGFTLVETNDDQATVFEDAWKTLDKEFFLAERFARADRLTAFGMYGILLIGFDDTVNIEDFNLPVSAGKRSIRFIRPFGQNSALIQQWVTDTKNERFGQPEFYNITTSEPGTIASSNILVHHSRVVHIVEDLLESETEGISRLEAPYNRFMDLEKLIGGSAEMFWRGARPGYHGKVDPEYTMTEETKTDLRDQIDEYEHNLRRILVNQGVDLQGLQQQVSDPKSHVDVQIEMISAVTGIPRRVLVGNEAGHLASTQDQEAWYAVIEERREGFAEPRIVRPFVDRCILYGVLPEPKDGDYSIEWPPMFEQSDDAKVSVGAKRASALKDYSSNPNAESIVPPDAFFEFFLGFDQDQIELIKEMVDAGMQQEDAAMKQLNLTPEQLDQIQNPQKYVNGKQIIPGTEQKQGAQPAKKAQPAGVKTQELENNSFPGHAGRPGQVGGSQSVKSAAQLKMEAEQHAKEKYARIAAFSKDHGKIMKKIEKDFNKSDEAKVLYLINKTGFRIGGQGQPGKHQVYGASTLKSEHIKVDGDKISFNFQGKQNVAQSHTITDAKMAQFLEGRLSEIKIFKTNDTKIRAYLKEISGKNYLVKDFRTYVATTSAKALVDKMPTPITKADKAHIEKFVSTQVSKILGNTPGMAKASYIDPSVWVWR